MNLSEYYSILVIKPIEKEIKELKKKLHKKINFTKEIDEQYLKILQHDLLKSYEKFYKIKEIGSK